MDHKKALLKFHELKLPTLKQEGWEYTDLSEFDLDKFKQTTQEVEFSKVENNEVFFTDLKTAMEKHRELFSRYSPMSLVNFDQDKFTAMHASYCNDGVFIYVPKNCSVELKNIFTTNKPGNVFSHTIIVLEEGASLEYIEEHISTSFKGECLRNDVVEVHAKHNSKVRFHNLQNWKNNVINLANWKGNFGKDCSVNWLIGQFGSKLSRIKIDSVMSGQGSVSNTYGAFFGYKKQHFDITTDIHHNVRNTSGDILVKGVLNDSATSVYRGKIKILKNAQNTNSYLSDHSLMLSNDAVSNSIPSLEIDANDVKASHGATIGKPDEREIFYLMSRGLNRTEAERLIISGYFSPIVEKIKNVKLKTKFENVIKEKLQR